MAGGFARTFTPSKTKKGLHAREYIDEYTARVQSLKGRQLWGTTPYCVHEQNQEPCPVRDQTDPGGRHLHGRHVLHYAIAPSPGGSGQLLREEFR